MLTALRQRNFALLWIGSLISLIGDWMLVVGLPIHVYNLTNSALITGISFMIANLPRIILGSVAGVFADRWDRKRLMIACDLLRAIAVLLLLLVRTADLIWLVYVVSALMSVLSQFFNPAQNALIPQMVSKEGLPGANAASSLNSNLTRLLGPAVAGALMALFGFPLVVVIDSVSFLLSATMIALIVVPGATAGPAAMRPSRSASLIEFWREWLAGLRLVGQHRVIAAIFVVVAILMPAEGILQVLYVLFVRQRLGGGAEMFGLLLTAQAVGGLAGSLLFAKLSQRVPLRLLIGASAILNGLLLVLIFNLASFSQALVLFALAGMPVVTVLIGVQLLLQQNTPPQYLGRVFGAFSTTIAIMALLGMGIASLLADRIGIMPLLNIEAGLNIFAGLGALWLIPLAAAPKVVASAETAQVS